MSNHPCEANLVDPAEHQLCLAEERFLLAAQVEIQRLLNDKGLRYRDLSKRLHVSEARVSQMLGDDASNLTIRTIAKIFYQLDERPMLISSSELQRRIAEAAGTSDHSITWTFAGAVEELAVDSATQLVEKELPSRQSSRPVSSKAWLTAENSREERSRRAA